ncbi:acyl carrier protein [Rhodococcus sp. G-MC3]|uniref:acyl carrier protein n=1 Tax=unclassified Rhodococcus (in: high G+C Gram-positive bacteria) TaxID=192944 RepID=UPI001C4E4F01|nr:MULTISPECIES: acyl carrier protein [unclassified Rhodococcus (in: high G+C Gram-positive bacteria)]MDJ0396223.1 acyl carrier protein [Rhodococcus sp. G-MC3]
MTTTLTTLGSILSTKFDAPESDLVPTVTFEELGLDDSLTLVELAVSIQRETGARLEDGQLYPDQTLGGAAALIDSVLLESVHT